MTLSIQGLAAVEQLAARFVFDDKAPAEMQRDLAQHIAAAIDDFKASEMQGLVARTLRRALRERVVAAIESWERRNDAAQPVMKPETEETAA
jgi:hypothetical protein